MEYLISFLSLVSTLGIIFVAYQFYKVAKLLADTVREITSANKEADYRTIEILVDGVLSRNLEEFGGVRMARENAKAMIQEAKEEAEDRGPKMPINTPKRTKKTIVSDSDPFKVN